VSILLADLMHPGLEIRVGPQDWTMIVRLLSEMNVVDAETLHRWDGATRVDVPRDVARRIGRHLEKRFYDGLREACLPPTIPDYIRPIATLNGLWIDPALPLLNGPVKDDVYLGFAEFCHICEGFSIG
jgi:hypothetical protein